MIGSCQRQQRRGAICIVINNEAVVNGANDSEDDPHETVNNYSNKRSFMLDIWQNIQCCWRQKQLDFDNNAKVYKPGQGQSGFF